MAHRVNFMLEDFVWWTLKQLDKGERSRLVNRALAEWLARHRRRSAALRTDRLRALLPPVSANEIAAWVREDRERDR